MRLGKTLLALCVALGASSPVMAMEHDDWMAPFDPASDNVTDALKKTFTAADDYEALEDGDGYDTLNDQLTPIHEGSAIPPSGRLSPFVLAVLMLQTHEASLDRVRYRIRYGMIHADTQPPKPPVPLSLIQVDRFNLGPEIRDQLVSEIGADQVAPEEEFGVGPHVSWRLITRPLMGHSALPEAVSRKTLSSDAANNAQCMGQSCTSLPSVVDEAAAWRNEGNTLQAPEEVTYEVTQNQLLTPAAAIDLLTSELQEGLNMEPRESASSGQPFIELVVETNLGQEQSLAAALHDNATMDDSIKGYWELLQALPGESQGQLPIYSDRAFECRRGDVRFAPADGYCL